MADWSNVEFGRSRKARRSQMVLPLLNELFMALDASATIATVIIGQVLAKGHAQRQWPALPAWLSLSLLLMGGLAAAFALSNSKVSCIGDVMPLHRLLMPALHRSVAIFIAIYCVARLAGIGHRETVLWLSGAPLFLFCVTISRTTVYYWLSRLRRLGVLRKSVAIIGPEAHRSRLAAQIAGTADIVGSFGLQKPDRLATDDLDQLLRLGRGGVVDTVLVTTGPDYRNKITPLIETLKVLPVELAICEDQQPVSESNLELWGIDGMHFTIVADRPINRRGLLLKNLMDKLGAVLLLVSFSPFLALIAVGIKATSEGPALFRQPRQGWCGQEFILFKFRTMHEPPDGTRWLEQTVRGDARCTRFGLFLRRTSLDELPQLWNVLRGEMSLVGPRPHAEYLHGVDRAGQQLVADYAQRHRVKPGLTGWAQIHGARGATTAPDQMSRRVLYDIYYIEHWSLVLDLKILALTPFCLIGENVY